MAESPPSLDLRDGPGGRPLRVLITRPDEQAEATAELVRLAGGEPLLFPCLHRAPPPDPVALLQAAGEAASHSIVAVTSANGATALCEALRQLGQSPSEALAHALVAAVGSQTAAALARQGLPRECLLVADEDSSGEGLARAIGERLQQTKQTLHGARVWFPRAAEARTELAAALRLAGATVIETVAYQMVSASPESLAPMVAHLRAGEVDLAPFGSPRTAAIALAAIGDAAPPLLSRVLVGALGRTTAAALEGAGVRVDAVAQPATFASLLLNLSHLARRRTLCQVELAQSPAEGGNGR